MNIKNIFTWLTSGDQDQVTEWLLSYTTDWDLSLRNNHKKMAEKDSIWKLATSEQKITH